MNIIKTLFDKNTRLGRGVRTALQGLVALTSFVYGFMMVPGLSDFLAINNIMTVASFGAWVGIISYLQNTLEDLMGLAD